MPDGGPRVIVNSTPLILLGNAGRLGVLRDVYGKVVIPDAVWREVTRKDDDAGRALLARPAWVVRESAPVIEGGRLFSARLHAGEVEVMSLALKTSCDTVVLDDNAARRTARFLGIPVTGTLGVLVRAKSEGVITEVGQVLDELRANGFFVRDAVAQRILELAGER